MSSMQLTTNHISPPDPLSASSPMTSDTRQTRGPGGGNASYVQNYMTLFPGQVATSDQAVVSSASQPLSHDPLGHCLPSSASPIVASPLDTTPALDETVAPSVITHTASSTVTPSDAATTYSSLSTQPPLAQHQAMAPSSVTQTFALPRPLQSSSSIKNRPVQRIAPATALPPSHLILTGLSLNLRSTY